MFKEILNASMKNNWQIDQSTEDMTSLANKDEPVDVLCLDYQNVWK